MERIDEVNLTEDIRKPFMYIMIFEDEVAIIDTFNGVDQYDNDLTEETLREALGQIYCNLRNAGYPDGGGCIITMEEDNRDGVEFFLSNPEISYILTDLIIGDAEEQTLMVHHRSRRVDPIDRDEFNHKERPRIRTGRGRIRLTITIRSRT